MHFLLLCDLFYSLLLGHQKMNSDIQIKDQQNAKVSQVYYLTFMCGSTCFGRFLAHHQELTTALTASGFTVGVWR
jgi:hypothetical protein